MRRRRHSRSQQTKNSSHGSTHSSSNLSGAVIARILRNLKRLPLNRLLVLAGVVETWLP